MANVLFTDRKLITFHSFPPPSSQRCDLTKALATPARPQEIISTRHGDMRVGQCFRWIDSEPDDVLLCPFDETVAT